VVAIIERAITRRKAKKEEEARLAKRMQADKSKKMR
jgi:hypothetical protein